MIVKSLLIALSVFASAPLFAQSSSPAMTARRDSIVQSLLARSPNGPAFYAQSPAFRKAIMLKAAMERSGMGSDTASASEHSFQTLSNDTVTIESEAQWQNTTAVSINRKNSNLIAVAAWDDLTWNHRLGQAVYVSDDAGLTWNTERLPRILHTESYGYPSLASDAEGRFFCAHQLLAVGACIVIALSQDGYSWKNALVSNDTNGAAYDMGVSIAVDLSPQSPHYDRVYVAWSHYDTANSGIQLVWSDDHGKTWTHPTSVDGLANVTQIRFGTHGELCLLYSKFPAQDVLAVSTDGGMSFERHDVASFTQYPEVILHTALFDDTTVGLKGRNGFEATAFATCSIDERNRLDVVYATWDTVHRCAELFATHTTDFGATWSDSEMVSGPSDPYFDRFYPWLSHDAVTSSTSLIYYSSEFDTANVKTTVVSKALGETGWEGNNELYPYPVDLTRCSANLETSIGSYIGSDENNSIFAAAWTTTKSGPYVIIPGQTDGRSDVIIYVSSPNSSVVMPVKVNADRLYLSAPFPNPAGAGVAHIDVVVPRDGEASLLLFDAAGKVVRQFFDQRLDQASYVKPLDLTGIIPGEYVLVLRSGAESVTQKIVVE